MVSPTKRSASKSKKSTQDATLTPRGLVEAFVHNADTDQMVTRQRSRVQPSPVKTSSRRKSRRSQSDSLRKRATMKNLIQQSDQQSSKHPTPRTMINAFLAQAEESSMVLPPTQASSSHSSLDGSLFPSHHTDTSANISSKNLTGDTFLQHYTTAPKTRTDVHQSPRLKAGRRGRPSLSEPPGNATVESEASLSADQSTLGESFLAHHPGAPQTRASCQRLRAGRKDINLSALGEEMRQRLASNRIDHLMARSASMDQIDEDIGDGETETGMDVEKAGGDNHSGGEDRLQASGHEIRDRSHEGDVMLDGDQASIEIVQREGEETDLTERGKDERQDTGQEEAEEEEHTQMEEDEGEPDQREEDEEGRMDQGVATGSQEPADAVVNESGSTGRNEEVKSYHARRRSTRDALVSQHDDTEIHRALSQNSAAAEASDKTETESTPCIDIIIDGKDDVTTVKNISATTDSSAPPESSKPVLTELLQFPNVPAHQSFSPSTLLGRRKASEQQSRNLSTDDKVQKKHKPPAAKQSRFSGLPRSLTKGIVEHFSSCRVSKEAMDRIDQVAEKYWKQTAEDLAAFAAHAGRKTINEADVQLLMTRQGFIKDRQSMHHLVEKYLPLEYREQLIPMARAGNVVVPKI